MGAGITVRNAIAALSMILGLCACAQEPDAPAREVWEGTLEQQRFEGESFSQIWGTDEELWVLGAPWAPLDPEVSSGMGPALLCGPDRFAGTNIVRRRRGDAAWVELEVPAETLLVALHGSASDDVWLVGPDGAVLQFDGEAFREHDLAAAIDIDFDAQDDPCHELSLSAVFASSPRDVWVVGYVFPSDSGPGLILHFDGESWRRHPIDAGDGLFDVWASAPDDVWVVGASGLAFHFDGTEWVRADVGTDQYLHAVYGLGPDDVWAAGNAAVTTHFDGASWTLQVDVQAHSGTGALTGDPEVGLWALTGRTGPSGLERQSLVRWDGAAWQEQAHTTDEDHWLADLWATPAGQLWGAGRGLVRFR